MKKDRILENLSILRFDTELYEKYKNEIIALCSAFGWTLKDAEEELEKLDKLFTSAQDYFFGALVDSKLVAFAWCRPANSSDFSTSVSSELLEKTINISYLVCDEKYRELGIAYRLISEAISGRDGYNFTLSVRKDNLTARNLYADQGFKIIKESNNDLRLFRKAK